MIRKLDRSNAKSTIADQQPTQSDFNRRFRTNGMVLTKKYVVWTTDDDVRRIEN